MPIVEVFGVEVEIDKKSKDNFKNDIGALEDSLKDFGSAILDIGQALGAAVAALAGFSILTNQAVAEQANLAKSVGLSAENLDVFTGVVDQLGLNAENVVDLVEEMNNKIGEKAGLGNMTAVEESVKILGLNFKEIKELKPEEQFLTILDAAKELRDEQQAVSAVDMLMGGESNKVVGFLRTLDGSLSEIIEKRRQLIVLSEESRQNAIEFNETWRDAVFVAKSVGAEFAAQFGKVMRPFLNDWIEWVAANRELLKQKIRDFIDQIVLVVKGGLGVFQRFYDLITSISETLGTLAGTARLFFSAFAAAKIGKIGLALGKVVTSLRDADTGRINLGKGLKGLGKLALKGGALALLALAIEDIVVGLQGGNSVILGTLREIPGVIKEQLAFAKNALKVFKFVVKGVLGVIRTRISEFIDTVAKGFRILAARFKKAFPFISKLLGGVGSAAKTVGQAQLSATRGVNEGLDAVALGPLRAVAGAASSVVNGGANVNTTINVVQQPGQDPNDLARQVSSEVETIYRTSTESGQEY